MRKMELGKDNSFLKIALANNLRSSNRTLKVLDNDLVKEYSKSYPSVTFECNSNGTDIFKFKYKYDDIPGEHLAVTGLNTLFESLKFNNRITDSDINILGLLGLIRYVDELPKCSFCSNNANYDVYIPVYGSNAYICNEHKEEFGIKRLDCNDYYLVVK